MYSFVNKNIDIKIGRNFKKIVFKKSFFVVCFYRDVGGIVKGW